MSRPTRIAMTGVGWVARVHARAIDATADAELVAVHGHRPVSVDAFVAEHPVPFATSSWDAFLERIRGERIDLAIVATPNVMHASQAIDLLDAGASVLVEKPMATSSADALAMLVAAEAADRTVMTGHMWRFDPDALWLRDQVAGGSLGRVVRTHGFGSHTWWGPSGWFTERARAGGGALADMGVHSIDTTRFLLGDPRPRRVTARITTNYGSYDVDDTALLLIDWEGGVSTVIEAGWWQVHAEGPEAGARLFGTQAFGSLFPTFVSREIEDERIVRHEPPPFARTEHVDPRLYAAQIAHAVEVARGRAKPLIGPEVGTTVVAIMEAAYRSAALGHEIDL